MLLMNTLFGSPCFSSFAIDDRLPKMNLKHPMTGLLATENHNVCTDSCHTLAFGFLEFQWPALAAIAPPSSLLVVWNCMLGCNL